MRIIRLPAEAYFGRLCSAKRVRVVVGSPGLARWKTAQRHFSNSTVLSKAKSNMAITENYHDSFSTDQAHRHRRRDVEDPVMNGGSIGDNEPLSEHSSGGERWALFDGKISVLQQQSNELQNPSTKAVPSEVPRKFDGTDAKHSITPVDTYYGTVPRTSLLMQLTDRVGILHDVLRWFWKFDVNICRIESRPVSFLLGFKVDFVLVVLTKFRSLLFRLVLEHRQDNFERSTFLWIWKGAHQMRMSLVFWQPCVP